MKEELFTLFFEFENGKREVGDRDRKKMGRTLWRRLRVRKLQNREEKHFACERGWDPLRRRVEGNGATGFAYFTAVIKRVM